MKKVVKRIILAIEKLTGIKSTRNLLLDTNIELFDRIEQLEGVINTDACSTENANYYRTIFMIINDIWKKRGSTKELMDMLNFLNQSELVWNNANYELWMIYISVLIENDDTANAEIVFYKLLNKYKDKIIWFHRYLLVSQLAYRLGYTKENIFIANSVWEKLQSSRRNRIIENILVDADSIAVVGNGPSMKGLGKGSEIDDHEIIIRFNNFATYGYEEDYGSSTDIWVKCSNDDIQHERYIESLKLVLYEADYVHHPMEYGYHKHIYREIQSKIEVDYLDYEIHAELREKLGGFPSTGLLVFYLIYKLGILYKVDFYGFSFQEQEPKKYASHYFEDRDINTSIKKSKHHDFNSESNFMKSLMRGEYDTEHVINDLINENVYEKSIANIREKECLKKVEMVHSLTYRPFSPKGGAGGGGAVLSCEKTLLGSYYSDLKLKYSFEKKNRYTNLIGLCDLCDLWGGMEFAIEATKEDRNTIYITHDYGTAYGLYILGKHYIYINHLQGPRVEEKQNFGENMTEKSKNIIMQCEKVVCENAVCVCYPSLGAAEYFEKSTNQCVELGNYRRGPILYNTLYAYPEPAQYKDISKDDKVITVLSVGQLTYAKGIDQCLPIIKTFIEEYRKPVRWFVVGQGPLEQQLIDSCEELKKQTLLFEYKIINRLKYEEILFLQDISDAYIMCQRISIFDLTTLEMMKKGKVIVLSNIGGNKEFNKENNIILHERNVQETSKRLFYSLENNYGKINTKVYDTYFSNEVFINNYYKLMDLEKKIALSGENIK